jgi:glycosyltransferase involved in cell wall biosynthesis
MRIGIDIHTVGALQTGNETYIKNIVSNLKTDHSLFLYYTNARREILPECNAHYRRVWPHNSLVRIPFSFPIALARDKIDVAHFQYVVPPVSPCRTVVMIHDISYEFFPEFFNPLSRKRMQMLIPFSARKSSHVLTISEHSRREIIERYRIPEEKISVTHAGVSEIFRRIGDEALLDSRLQRFSLTNPFILAVGNLQPRKNIKRLVRVYAQLRHQEKIHQDLVLVGKMDYNTHEIFDTIRQYKVEPFVKSTGYVNDEELVALYNRADIFVYPSLYEGFGLPLIESMACGTPVITSRVSSLPEVAGDAALYIDPESDDDLGRQLLQLSDDESLRRSLIEKGKDRAESFSWEKAARKTLEGLEKACQ